AAAAPDWSRRFRGIYGGPARRGVFFFARRFVATAPLARDRATIVPFDRGRHPSANLPWNHGDAAWAHANGDGLGRPHAAGDGRGRRGPGRAEHRRPGPSSGFGRWPK